MMPYFKNLKNNLKLYLAASLTILVLATGTYATYKWINSSETSILTQPPTEIKGSIITLRLLEEKYFIDYHNMFSPTVRKGLEFPESITLNYTIQYLHDEKKQSDEGKMLQYCIFDNKDNKLIGVIEVREPDEKGQFGCWVNEAYWGGGRFQEATDLISNTYFRLKPHEKNYIAHVRLWNKRSYYALKKAGFEEIGYAYEDGKPAMYILELKRK